MSNIQELTMGRVNNIHFVGIGGAGMCGIAEILHNLGYSVSGSDIKSSTVTIHLEKMGITIHQGHQSGFVNGTDVVVFSSAVTANNPELIRAREMRIPVIPRAEMLAEIMRFRHGIAVAGTHGKTTTTSLIASILAEEGLDPTYVIGGQLNSIGSNAKLGSGKYLVAEADESDASFLHLQPMIAVLTNIDADHLGTYNNDFNCLREAFLDFLQRLPFYGLAVLCINDKGVQEIIADIIKPNITFGIDVEADYIATDIFFDRTHSSFTVSRPGNNIDLEINLNLPGRHNVLNALAAIAVATEIGVSDDSINCSLKNFQGISRRCDVLGEVTISGKQLTIIDDYAHHPSEIREILYAIDNGWKGYRTIVIFQPHRFSRTRELFIEFCDVLSNVENLLLLNVFPAGELPLPNADSASLCKAITKQGKSRPKLVQDRNEIQTLLPELVIDNDILLILGAGDVGTLGPELINNFRESVH
ncbi:MAG: UDP-N-acetylmuramate--L-alanine ligase [Gammaproteobacteria bacterium]